MPQDLVKLDCPAHELESECADCNPYYLDKDEYELHFDCPKCKKGIFSMRISAEELKHRDPASHMIYFCPRGHRQTRTSYRGYVSVDSSGYAITESHIAYESLLKYLRTQESVK